MTLKVLAFAGVIAAAVAFGASANAATVYTFNDAALTSSPLYGYAPDQHNKSYATGVDAAVSGVTFSGTSGVATNGSAFGFATSATPQVAFIQWYNGAAAEPGTLSLDLGTLVTGKTYDVSILDAARSYGAASAFTVSYGATSKTVTPSSTAFGTDTFSFVAGAGDSQLVFAELPNASVGDVTTAIQSVTLSGGVPEPAAWGLMIVGLGAIGSAMRSAKRNSLTAAV
jgi:hypothetical protein